jgi:hypothetical protein
VTVAVVVGPLDVPCCVLELVVLEPPVIWLMALVTADGDMVVVPVVSLGCAAILADGDVTLPLGNGPAVTPALVGAATEVGARTALAALTGVPALRLKLASQTP